MAKGNSFPALLLNVEQLKSLDITTIPNGLPFIVSNIWYMLSKEHIRQGNRIDEIPNNTATFLPMPFRDVSTPTNFTVITANTAQTIIDLNTVTNLIYINLTTNTELVVSNFKRYNEYVIGIQFNNYKITNLFNVARWNIKPDELIDSFNDILLFKLTRADVVNANIVTYGDYFTYKDKNVLFQVVPANDGSYFERYNSNVNYSYSGTNDGVKLTLTNLTIPYNQKYNLSNNTQFQFYIDFTISSYSATYIDLLSFWGAEQVFRIEINQNTIRYVYRTLTFTYTFASNFINNRRYKVEVVRVPTDIPANALSIRILDTTTDNFLTPQTTTTPTQSQINTTGINHIPFLLENGVCRVSELYSLVWTNVNTYTTILNRNFTTYPFSLLESPKSFNRRLYLRQSNIVLYVPLESATTINDSVNAITGAITGTANYVNTYLSLSSGSFITYVKNNNFNLNNTDFSISFYVKFTDTTNNGTIASIWGASSKQFIIGVTQSFLIIRFRTVLEIVNLDVNISTLKITDNTHYIEIVRSGFQYIVFIDGTPVRKLFYSDATMNFASTGTEFIIGKPMTFDNNLPFSANSFNGLIKDVKIARTSPNVTSYRAIQPRDANPTALVLWKFYISEFELVNNLSYTQRYNPFLSVVDNRNVLANEAHFSITNPALNLGGTGTTIEAYITVSTLNNTSVNGTIVQLPTELQFGLSGQKLRIVVPSASLDLTGTIDVSLGQRVHIAYVRSSNTHTLYVNGVANGTTTATWTTTIVNQDLYVKRVNTDNNSASTPNNTNFSGKPFCQIDSLAILPFAKYNTNFTPEVEI